MNCLYRCYSTAIVGAIRTAAVGRLKVEGKENAGRGNFISGGKCAGPVEVVGKGISVLSPSSCRLMYRFAFSVCFIRSCEV